MASEYLKNLSEKASMGIAAITLSYGMGDMAEERITLMSFTILNKQQIFKTHTHYKVREWLVSVNKALEGPSYSGWNDKWVVNIKVRGSSKHQ